MFAWFTYKHAVLLTISNIYSRFSPRALFELLLWGAHEFAGAHLMAGPGSLSKDTLQMQSRTIPGQIAQPFCPSAFPPACCEPPPCITLTLYPQLLRRCRGQQRPHVLPERSCARRPGELGSRQRGFIPSSCPPDLCCFFLQRLGSQGSKAPVPDGAVLMDVAEPDAACGLPGGARLSQKGPAEPGGAQQSPAVTSHLRRAPSRLCQSCA